MKKNTGFTLIELVMVIIIVSIIAAGSSALFMQGSNAYITNTNLINATWQGQISLERMTRDIRAIRSPNDIITASSSQLQFVDSSGNTQNYTTSGTTITLNGNVLADGINSLTFSYYDKNGNSNPTTTNIAIILIAVNVTQGGTNFSWTTGVVPRNL